MGDCGVCLTTCEETVSILRESDESKSRKDRKCIECRQVIPAGTPHQLHVGSFEGEIEEYRTCQICAEIRKAFLAAEPAEQNRLANEMQRNAIATLAVIHGTPA